MGTHSLIEKDFKGLKFNFQETKTAPQLIEEVFSDNYRVFESGVKIAAGDVIVDAGANEGMFSVLMSKFFPEARIIALEPITRTREILEENLRVNGCENVVVCPYALGTGDDTTFTVSKDYTGGSSGLIKFKESDHYQEIVSTLTLSDVFDLYRIDRCRLLKLDIEGMEYDVLYAAGELLRRVDYLSAEFHLNNVLDFNGRRIEGLANWVSNRTKVLHVDVCRMAD